ncbi:MAG: YgiT-type zinc finger protein [Chloroflexota bacterium]
MRCTVCGGALSETITDLPFNVGDTSIVILKDLPVLECERCPEYLIEDGVMSRVDRILARTDSSAGLKIIRFAA